MPPGRVKLLITDTSTAIKTAVDNFACETDESRNDVIGQAIAARYGLKFIASGGGYRPGADLGPGPWSVEVPENLRRKLRVEAARRGGTISGLVRETLALKFGLPAESIERRPR